MRTSRLRTVIVASVLGATTVVFALVYAGMSLAYDRAVKRAAERSTGEFAQTVFGGLHALMKAGVGQPRLEEFLDTFRNRSGESGGYQLSFYRFLDGPPAAGSSRGGIVAKAPPDRQVMETAGSGLAATARAGAAVRVLVPFKATADCQRCHPGVAIGQTLGVVDVVHDVSPELRNGRNSIALLLFVLAPVPLFGAGLGVWTLGRRIHRSVALVDENFPDVDIAGKPAGGDSPSPDLGFVEFDTLFASLVRKLRRTEEHLKRNEMRFRSLIENASDLITVLAPNGAIEYASPAAERVSGYRQEELAGAIVFDLIHPDDRQGTASALERARANPGVAASATFRLRNRDGTWRTLEAIGTALVEASGTARAAVVTARDVTERERIVQALQESEERFRSLYESMSEGVAVYQIVYDEPGRPRDLVCLDVNPSFESITGLTAEKVVGHKVSEFGASGVMPLLENWAIGVEAGKPKTVEMTVEDFGKTLRISGFSPARDRFATIFEEITELRDRR
jgi:PAS domain S-box-containing protein